MDVKLILVGAKTGTKEIFVRRPRILGRAKSIGIVIPHPTVSDRHCLLFEHNGLLMVQDLNSLQGTLVGGRKIIMAPLPPGAEFTVGPLTFRAEYAYPGDLNALPKTLYAEAETEPAAPPSSAVHVSTNGQAVAEAATSAPSEVPPMFFTLSTTEAVPTAETTAPSANAPAEFPSFFGLGSNDSYPVVASAAQPVQQPKPSVTPPVVPPPLPKIVEKPRPELEPKPIFGEFAEPVEKNGEEFSEHGEESDAGIPGFVVDPSASQPPLVQPEPPVKKKPSGSLLDFFSKRPSRRRRVIQAAPNDTEPVAPADKPPLSPPKQAPASAKGVWSQEVPKIAAMPPLEPPSDMNPAPPDSIDDDLSNFFKKLE